MSERKPSKYNNCIGDQLRDKKFKDKPAVIAAFREAVKFCKVRKK